MTMEGNAQALIGDLIPGSSFSPVGVEFGNRPLREGQADVLGPRGDQREESFEIVPAQDCVSTLGIGRLFKGSESLFIERLDPMGDSLPIEPLLAGDLSGRDSMASFEDDLISVVDSGGKLGFPNLVPEVSIFPGSEFPEPGATRCSSSHVGSRWQTGERILPATEAGRPRRTSILQYPAISLELH